MTLEAVGQELHQELQTIATWFSPGSLRHLKVQGLLTKLEDAGVKPATTEAGDVTNLATPGPGVRAQTVQTVDSVGDVADTAVDSAETRRQEAQAAAEAAKKAQSDQKPPAG